MKGPVRDVQVPGLGFGLVCQGADAPAEGVQTEVDVGHLCDVLVPHAMVDVPLFGPCSAHHTRHISQFCRPQVTRSDVRIDEACEVSE